MMKKFYVWLCCIIMTAGIIFACSGCVYMHMEPGVMSELKGTYKLTTYTVTPDAKGEYAEVSYKDRQKNMLKLNGVEAYMVITGDSSGYYYYKDNDTDWWCESMSINYNYSETNDGQMSDRIKSVDIDTGLSDVYYVPGMGKETAGFNVKQHNLNYRKNAYNGKYIKVDATTDVVYKRVSKDATTAYVEKTLGKSFTVPRYELKKFGSVFRYNHDASYQNDVDFYINPFIYCYLALDNRTMNATVHYALKADYEAGKRGAELNKTENVKAEITETETELLLDIKFKCINDNSVFSINKGTTMATYANGNKFYYKYDTNISGYVLAEKTDDFSSSEARDKFEIFCEVSQIPEMIEQAVSDYEEARKLYVRES